MGDLVPRKDLTKQGVQGVGGVGGGAILLLAASNPILGGIVGGILVLSGLAFGKSKGDRISGAILTGAGTIGILSAIFSGGFFDGLLRFGGIGLLAFGGWKLIQFILNLRKRS